MRWLRSVLLSSSKSRKNLLSEREHPTNHCWVDVTVSLIEFTEPSRLRSSSVSVTWWGASLATRSILRVVYTIEAMVVQPAW